MSSGTISARDRHEHRGEDEQRIERLAVLDLARPGTDRDRADALELELEHADVLDAAARRIERVLGQPAEHADPALRVGHAEAGEVDAPLRGLVGVVERDLDRQIVDLGGEPGNADAAVDPEPDPRRIVGVGELDADLVDIERAEPGADADQRAARVGAGEPHAELEVGAAPAAALLRCAAPVLDREAEPGLCGRGVARCRALHQPRRDRVVAAGRGAERDPEVVDLEADAAELGVERAVVDLEVEVGERVGAAEPDLVGGDQRVALGAAHADAEVVGVDRRREREPAAGLAQHGDAGALVGAARRIAEDHVELDVVDRDRDRAGGRSADVARRAEAAERQVQRAERDVDRQRAGDVAEHGGDVGRRIDQAVRAVEQAGGVDQVGERRAARP
ncbi:MAG: hypothetical protein E6J91_42185 [Deltaproteobacteria bacterium]|nr:MAG: hypothetical protein E6J91_42185 [Deltaproteobacteria bacterium]